MLKVKEMNVKDAQLKKALVLLGQVSAKRR